MDLNNVSANWKKLQRQLKTQENQVSNSSAPKRKREESSRRGLSRHVDDRPQKKRRHDTRAYGVNKSAMQSPKQPVNRETNATEVSDHAKDNINAGLSTSVEVGKYIAVDCEMVGVGPQPGESALARVSIVNFDGDQVYDSFVKPKEMVTDWRTHVSGIMPKHMIVARSFEEVQKTVSDLLKDRVLIGHSVSHDLEALLLSHPRRDIRDTARHPAYRRLAGGSSPRLKILASELLGVSIQAGEHSSIEDARACMLLFRRDKAAFEREHARKFPAPKPPPPTTENGTAKPKKHKKKKKKK